MHINARGLRKSRLEKLLFRETRRGAKDDVWYRSRLVPVLLRRTGAINHCRRLSPSAWFVCANRVS